VAAAGADSILHRHLAADVRDAGPAVPVAVGVRVAEVARRLVAAGAVCWSAAGETVVVILNAGVVASLRADALIGRTPGGRAFRTDSGTFCWAFGTHGGTFGPDNVRPLGPISWSLGPARSRAFWPATRSVRSACAGSIRSARARSLWPAWPRNGLVERLEVGPFQDGLVEGPDDPAACHRQDDPDARRPAAVRLGGVGDANWAEAVAILAD
jgi:hypothetical protein